MNAATRHWLGVTATLVSLVCVYLALFVIQLGAPVMAAYSLHDVKVAKLYVADRIRERKIVILGGSNALLGIDSAGIEGAIGIRAVNLGLHGGLPLTYMIETAKGILRPGDVVVMLLEYEYYWAGSADFSWFTSNMMAWEEDYFWRLSALGKLWFIGSVPPKRIVNGVIAALAADDLRSLYGREVRTSELVLTEAREVWEKRLYADQPFTYSLRGMNEYGDLQNNRGAMYDEDFPSLLAYPFPHSRTVWAVLAGFLEYCDRRGIDLMLGWPPTLRNPELDAHMAAVRRHMQEIAGRARAIKLRTLGAPEDFILDRQYFFNTNYHLNEEGRRIRTQMLLPYLQRALSK